MSQYYEMSMDPDHLFQMSTLMQFPAGLGRTEAEIYPWYLF